jgi:hypothetical protein
MRTPDRFYEGYLFDLDGTVYCATPDSISWTTPATRTP